MFDLKISFKCNNNCKHCVVADKRECGSLDMPHIIALINKIPKEETVVQITGGEPSIVSSLPVILKTCKERNLQTIIQSNGTGFSNKIFAKQCAPYIDHAHIAIHSNVPEIHDEIVGSKGMWKKTIEGFRNLIDLGIYVTTQTVLSQYNIESLYDTFSFIQKEKPGINMSMTYPHMLGNAYHNREKVAFRYSDHKEVIQKTLKAFGPYIFTEAIPPCYLHPNFPSCTAEMEILSGSIRRGIDFSQDFNNKNYNMLDIRDHRKVPRCKECIYNSICIGVWKEYIELFKTKLDLYPIKEN